MQRASVAVLVMAANLTVAVGVVGDASGQASPSPMPRPAGVPPPLGSGAAAGSQLPVSTAASRLEVLRRSGVDLAALSESREVLELKPATPHLTYAGDWSASIEVANGGSMCTIPGRPVHARGDLCPAFQQSMTVKAKGRPGARYAVVFAYKGLVFPRAGVASRIVRGDGTGVDEVPIDNGQQGRRMLGFPVHDAWVGATLKSSRAGGQPPLVGTIAQIPDYRWSEHGVVIEAAADGSATLTLEGTLSGPNPALDYQRYWGDFLVRRAVVQRLP